MTTIDDAIERLVKASIPDSNRIVREFRRIPAFGESLYQRIVSLQGSNPEEASQLERLAPALRRFRKLAQHGWRIEGLRMRRKGNWLESATCFQTAATLERNRAARDIYLIPAIDSLGRAAKFTEAESLAQSLWVRFRRRGDSARVVRVCINAGNALLWADRYASARRWFDRARRALVSDDQFASASINLGSSTCALFAGSITEAIRLGNSAKEKLASFGLDGYAAIAQMNVAHAFLLSGRSDEALGVLLDSRSAPLSDVDRARAEEFLADAYLQLNCFDEALDAYRTALSMPGITASRINEANCHLGLGDGLIALGQVARAKEEWAIARKLYRKLGNEVWAAWADLKIIRTQSKKSFAREMERNLAVFKRLENRPFELRAMLDLARFHPDRSLAAEWLKRAQAILNKGGYVGWQWEAYWIEAQRSKANPLASYRKMAAAIRQSRLLVRSTTASTHFYDDKIVAMAEYLGLLLSSGRTKWIAEAREAIAEARSAALIDEILSDRNRNSANPDDLANLESLRQEILAAQASSTNLGQERRAPVSNRRLNHLNRRWIELDRKLNQPSRRMTEADPDTLVFSITANGVFGIYKNRALRISDSIEIISAKLKWLAFEILDPMLNPDVDPECALQAIRNLKSALWDPFIQEGAPVSICPEGVLWQVPWQIFAYLDGAKAEPQLKPHADGAHDFDRKSCESMAIWYFPQPGLDHIELEAEAFLARNPGAIVCRTIPEAREMLNGGRIEWLHIASHASFHRTNPMFSAVCHMSEKILAAEIARADFRVRNVVLSACDTGISSFSRRYEVEGLTRAFMVCGAQEILATQWAFHDEAAAAYMNVLYHELKSGNFLANAMKTARAKTQSKFAHPYFWGAPALFRGYAQ